MENPPPSEPGPGPEAPLSPVRKYNLLRQQHAKLYVEREHLIVNVRRNIIAGFQRKLGAYDTAHKKAEWQVGRLKRELELIRESEDPDYDRISAALEEEFDPRERELEEAPRQLEWANQRLNAMMTREQTAAFQARYRRLAERLHPDLRLNQSATAANIWQRVRDSYASGDAAELEALELLAEDLPLESPEALPEAEIEARVATLKKASEAVINEIAAMREEWPFPLAAKLPDEAWVQAQRAEYEEKTAALLKEREALAAQLNGILDTRPADHG